MAANKNVYEALVEAGCEIANYESDLHVKYTELSSKILAQYGHTHNMFKSAIDGSAWFDVPFQYAPYWEAKSKSMAQA